MEVKMDKMEIKEDVKKAQVPHKLSYEELENACQQLSQQAQQLSNQNKQLQAMLQNANLVNLYKKLEFLFKVTQEENSYLSEEFKVNCGKEIESLMTVPTDEEVETGEDSSESTEETTESTEETTEEQGRVEASIVTPAIPKEEGEESTEETVE